MNSELNTFENISVAKLKTFVEDDNLTILDIRDEQSFQEGHIPDAIHLSNRNIGEVIDSNNACLLYTSPSPRDRQKSRMPSSA